MQQILNNNYDWWK